MSKSLLLSLLGAAVLGSALLAGCGDADKKPTETALTPSGSGESCVRTADCATGLVCSRNVCTDNPNANTDGGVIQPPLGGMGESCQAHSDCASNLGCYNGICAAAPMGDAGVSVQLGKRGESCQAASDCATGLTCVPLLGLAASICDLATYPTPTPSGMACGECKKADDCCELPASVTDTTTYGVIHSCADVTDALSNVTCTSTTITALQQQLCFLQATYCSCSGTTWACTNNLCEYTAPCSASNVAKNGCPTESRTGRVLYSTCDTAGSKKCQPATTTATGCTSDDDCGTNTLPVFDDLSGDTCSVGECACVVATGKCYRTCGRDIDCPVSYVCDSATTHLCVPQPKCTDNAECVISQGDVTAMCVAGVCQVPCVTDHDCSSSGATPGTVNGSTCVAGYCSGPTNCLTDNQCSTTGNRRTFCVALPTPGAVTTVVSAITGGNNK